MSAIIPCLWFPTKAVEACEFYVSLFPDSRIDALTTLPADTPGGPEGTVQVVDFTLAGQQFMAMNAGPLDDFNHAVSFVVRCEDQAAIDRLWERLSDGGTEEPCGWLKDPFGLSWQIVPMALTKMLRDPDHARAQRVMHAVLGMQKLDLAPLQRAFDGRVE